MANTLKNRILELSKKAGVGHIGSALSIVDILEVLYDDILQVNIENKTDDIFVLSKGHAALAWFVVLEKHGFLSKDDLETYCQDHTLLGVHPEHYINGIAFSTGSLGQGLTFAVGAALGAKLKKSSQKVYCLMSDAELNEGSFWETILFASQHKLNNLIIILDDNKQQALGYTKDVIEITDIATKMSAFGFETSICNGHYKTAIKENLATMNLSTIMQPKFIAMNTVCGSGVSFMEHTIDWHYKSLNDENYNKALEELS